MRAFIRQCGLMTVLASRPTPSLRKEGKNDDDDDDDAAVTKGGFDTTDASNRQASGIVYGILISSLDDERMAMIMHIEEGDAYAVWMCLTNHYERSTMASKSHTRMMLHTSRMSSDESFAKYVSRIVALQMRLKGMSEDISEAEMMYVVLNGLPDSYGAIKAALEMMDNIKFESVCEKLRDYEEKMAYKRAAAADYGSLQHGANGAVVNPDYKCKLCQQRGHYEMRCKKRKGGHDDCFRCGESGHRMRDCDAESHTANAARFSTSHGVHIESIY